MLVIAICLGTSYLSYVAHKRTSKFPSLQFVIVVGVAISAIIQSLKFFFLMFLPDIAAISEVIGSQAWPVPIPAHSEELVACVNSVGSEFDRFYFALGPVAVIWMSAKQIVELLPDPPKSSPGTPKQVQ